MTTYKIEITKILEDGMQVSIFTETGPGWFISPWLNHWAKKTHEPRPKLELQGQQEFPLAS